MVPNGYDLYFATVATAAAALIGLLFVAVSLREESIFGGKARAAGEALAIMAFIGLVNSFTVAVLALIPDTNVGFAAIVLAVISIVGIMRMNNRLHTARNWFVLAITLAAYGAQAVYGAVLIAQPHAVGGLPSLAYILLITLVVSLQRAWSLLRGRHLTEEHSDSGPATFRTARTRAGATSTSLEVCIGLPPPPSPPTTTHSSSTSTARLSPLCPAPAAGRSTVTRPTPPSSHAIRADGGTGLLCTS